MRPTRKLVGVCQILGTRDDAHFIILRISAKTTVSRRSRTLRIHDGVKRHASRRDACSSRPRAPKGLLQKHTACDQAMIIRPTSGPGRTRFSLSTPRVHLRPDRVGATPVGADPGSPPGSGSGGRSVPHITLISHPRGLGGGEERRLDHQHGASRRRGSSMTCHATLPLELFAAWCVSVSLARWTGGTLLPRLCSPPSDACERTCRCHFCI